MRKRDGIGIYISREKYRGGDRWRVIVLEDGERHAETFATEGEAKKVYEDLLRQTRDKRSLTVGDIVDAFCTEAAKRCEEVTVEGYRRFTVAMSEMDELAADVTPADAQRLYDRYKVGHATTTHHQALQMVKQMWRWAVEEEMVKRNPFRKVIAEGKRNRGRAQLHVDESRSVLEVALADIYPRTIDRYTAGRRLGSLGASLALLCGLRNSEVRGLIGRDIDDRGRLVWIADGGGKTRNATRVEVAPERLRSALVARAKEAGPEGVMFPRGEQWLVYHAKRLCRAAGVRLVTPHGMRGTWSTLGVAAGETSQAVANSLGHGGKSGTRVAQQHYISQQAIAEQKAGRVAEVLSFPTLSHDPSEESQTG